MTAGRRGGSAGQASVEAVLVLIALIAAAAFAGLFGEDGGLAGAWIDALRGFHRGFTTALSLGG